MGWIEDNQDTINFIIAVVLLLSIVFVFSVVNVYFGVDRGEVAARVNGEPIYMSQVEERSAPPAVALESLISEELLIQEAERLEITATEEEVDEALQQMLANNGLDEEGLNQILQLQGISERQLMNTLERQVRMNKVLEQQALAGIEVTDSEALDYYNQNVEQFVTPELARVKQTLIPQNASEQTALAIYESEEELCKASAQYLPVEETACGTYNISRFSGLPQEFVTAAFEMEEGTERIVETDMGYHVIQKLDHTSESLIRFETVKPDIKRTLLQARQRAAYSEYITELRSRATIENYMADEVAEEIQQEIEEQQPPTMEETITCVTDKATLYGAKWDSQTKKQLAELANITSVNYIECALPDTLDDQRQACEEEGIEGYPTWKVDGELHPGVLSWNRLVRITGC